MTEEEKKATIELNHFSNITAYWKKQEYTNSEINNYIKIVLNLIATQQKEIEELKKDKLELINKHHVVHLKDVEKELREMRKAIDTKNVEIECLNVIHESYKEMVEENNYISKDKIREKIEEYNKMINGTYEDITHYADYRRDVYFEIKNVLNELLEE